MLAADFILIGEKDLFKSTTYSVGVVRFLSSRSRQPGGWSTSLAHLARQIFRAGPGGSSSYTAVKQLA